MNKRLRPVLLLLVGVVLAILPVLGANLFMRDYVRTQGGEQLDVASARLLLHAENMIQEAIDVFSVLPHYRVPVCDKKLQKKFLQMTLRHPALHDVGLVYDDVFMYCSSIEESTRFEPTSEPVTGAVEHLKYVAVSDPVIDKHGLLVSWSINNSDSISVGGFILDDRLLLDALPIEFAQTASTSIQLSSGQVVVETTPETRFRKAAPFATFKQDPLLATDLIAVEGQSSRYPIMIQSSVPFRSVWASFSGVMNVINGLGILTGAMILFLFIRLSMRKEKPYVSIEEGIKRREFVPYYQPVIDIQTGRLAGCEVLVRWRKPDGKVVPPGAFIGIAEASGLARPMTTLLMEQVAEELSDAYSRNPQLKAGINLFNRHFNDLGVVSEIEQIFGNSGVRFDQLLFEITERQPLENLDRARAIIARMQSLGVKVALDDAGTGHGGFAYLQKLGMDVIKIDKLFVDAIGPDSESVPIIDSLCQMAKGMGMLVVAEGVETETQLAYLRRSGIEQAQGYLFAPALPGKAYLDLVEAMARDGKGQDASISDSCSNPGFDGETASTGSGLVSKAIHAA